MARLVALLAIWCVLQQSEASCPESWYPYKGICYLSLGSDTAETFSDAKDKCAELGATVVSLPGEEEALFVYRMLEGRVTWLGLTRDDIPTQEEIEEIYASGTVYSAEVLEGSRSKNWQWEDGSEYSYPNTYNAWANYAPRLPNGCVVIYDGRSRGRGGVTWYGMDCDRYYPVNVICQKPAAPEATSDDDAVAQDDVAEAGEVGYMRDASAQLQPGLLLLLMSVVSAAAIITRES